MVRKINDHNKNKEKKLMEREEKKKAQEEKAEETKPFFNWKSMLIVLAGATFAVTLFPFMLSFIGIPVHIGSVIGNTFITSFACAWTRFFVDNKKGFCKGRNLFRRSFIVCARRRLGNLPSGAFKCIHKNRS